MPAIESSPFISQSLRDAVPTDVDTELPITRDNAREKWQELIDYKLIEWIRDPSQLEDDEMPSPSGDTIERAIWLADMLRCSGVPAPTRIVPDAHGGIVFERKKENVFESIRISADGSAEYCFFQNSRLVEREPRVLS